MERKEIILAKLGEIALKGQNKHVFEQMLVSNIKRRIKSLGKFSYTRAQSTIYVEPLEDSCDVGEALNRMQKIFGIASLS
ncbi:MAG: tRNA 4-thiouridine(8) synthase ThiI, partial [Oscillospiraceae bacterium]|nr:tRNA 4-thiouridine(8) synthase ThiI [Oscillospiraceae bacterium]